jgi:hypothetical protein
VGRTTAATPATRSLSTVSDLVELIRSAVTVAGMVGHCTSNCRICGSTASTIDPLAGRWYLGGPSAASARRTVLRPIRADPPADSGHRFTRRHARCHITVSIQQRRQANAEPRPSTGRHALKNDHRQRPSATTNHQVK